LEEIAQHFETTPAAVRDRVRSYRSKLRKREVVADEFDVVFWREVKKEAEGDEKVTFLSDKGFHHAWKSELRKLDGRALMAIYEATRDFLDSDPNRRFLDFPPPKGYDPLAMERETKRSLEVISAVLGEKWEEEKKRSKGDTKRRRAPSRVITPKRSRRPT